MKTKFEDIYIKLTALEKGLEHFALHFTNHISSHRWDRLFGAIYFLVVVVMFCWLKWGK